MVDFVNYKINAFSRGCMADNILHSYLKLMIHDVVYVIDKLQSIVWLWDIH